MKAIRLYGNNDLRFETIDPPSPRPGEVLLRTLSIGVCGSDVHYFQEGGTGSLSLEGPLILGHEFSAQIESGPLLGKMVAVDPAVSCGQCEFCLEGNPNFCVNLKFAGSENTDGAMRTHLAWPEKALHILPSNIAAEEGAMLEPLGIAIHALRLGKVFPGMDVGVFGAGPIGLLTIQLAKLAGAKRIFTTDKLSSRLEFARKCGATDTYLADGAETGQILSATASRGLDVTFEAAGDDGSAVETAIKTAKPGATTVLIGIPTVDITKFSASAARRRGLTIKFSRRMKNTFPLAISLVSSGQIDVKSLITHTFRPNDYLQAFQTAADRKGIKVLINF